MSSNTLKVFSAFLTQWVEIISDATLPYYLQQPTILQANIYFEPYKVLVNLIGKNQNHTKNRALNLSIYFVR